MKKIYLFICAVILLSCKKTFPISHSGIKEISTEKINGLDISNDYFNEIYYPSIVYFRNLKINQNKSNYYHPIERTEKITVEQHGRIRQIDKKDYLTVHAQKQLEEYGKSDKFKKSVEEFRNESQTKERKEKLDLRPLFDNIDKKGILININTKNNSSQNIEKLKITFLITYTFSHKSFNFIYEYLPKIHNNIWNKNENLEVNIPIVYRYGENFTTYEKMLKLHKPNEISISYFFSAENSVGFQNFKKNATIIPKFGVYNESVFSEEELKIFGERMYTENITNL